MYGQRDEYFEVRLQLPLREADCDLSLADEGSVRTGVAGKFLILRSRRYSDGSGGPSTLIEMLDELAKEVAEARTWAEEAV